jgi:N-acetylmuramoyl-L-alanine amidase
MSDPSFLARPSPNFDPRPEGQTVDMLVLHYTGMQTAGEALARLCDPQAKVSAHYLIDEDGSMWRLVNEKHRAWHAGVAAWRGQSDINARSIGVELVNPGHEFGYKPFTPGQMNALVALSRGIVKRHAIPARNVVGHADVAPSRRQDPGELFSWERLADQGVGLWPKQDEPKGDPDPGRFLKRLALYGYDVADAQAAVIAFQRHFRQKQVDGRIDAECAGLLDELFELSA